MADKLVKPEGLPETACQHLWWREGTLQFVTPPSFPASNPLIPRCTKYNAEPPDMAAECIKGEEHCPLAQQIRSIDEEAGRLVVSFVHAMLGRHEEAIAAYKQAIRLEPDYADAHLGLTYFLLGDRGAALKRYCILKGLDPSLAEKLFELLYP